MRYIIIILLLCSAYAIGEELIWSQVDAKHLRQLDGQKILITGKLSYFKKYIRARDNFYRLKVQNPKGEEYIDIKLYTIKGLRRVNYFDCKEGQKITLKGYFYKKEKKKRLGKMEIVKKADFLECK